MFAVWVTGVSIVLALVVIFFYTPVEQTCERAGNQQTVIKLIPQENGEAQLGIAIQINEQWKCAASEQNVYKF